jgi:hypothetical protein
VRHALKQLAILLAFVCATAPSLARAADGISGTWSSGPGPNEQTFVFLVQGDAFIGIVCGPCDDATRVTFSIVRDDGGPLFGKLGPYREQATGTLTGTQLAIQTRREGESGNASSMTLKRVLGKRSAAPAATTALAPPTLPSPTPAAIDGRWVAVGRVAQQNVTLKVRGNKVSGVICGPCDDPDGVFLIEDGALDGNTISFYIHHIDTPVASVQANGPGRNFMKGTISGNVIRFKWVREGRETEPGGEMVLIGPIR